MSGKLLLEHWQLTNDKTEESTLCLQAPLTIRQGGAEPPDPFLLP